MKVNHFNTELHPQYQMFYFSPTNAKNKTGSRASVQVHKNILFEGLLKFALFKLC